MKKTFYATQDITLTPTVFFAICGAGYFLLSWSSGTLVKTWWVFVCYYFFLIFFWFAILLGTYKKIDENKIISRVMFIPGKTIYISDISTIQKRGIFGGIMTELYTISRTKNGKLEERGLTTTEMLRADDLAEFIEAIHSINLNIKIPSNLLN
jgi:hypothetical protein